MPDNNWVQQKASAEARQAVFEAIAGFSEIHGYAPLRSEVAEATGLAVITVRRHIKALIEEGRVAEDKGPRTLRVLE